MIRKWWMAITACVYGMDQPHEWRPDPTYRDGQMMLFRHNADGTTNTRSMTDTEQSDYVSRDAW